MVCFKQCLIMRRARRGSRFILITIVFLVYSALLVYSDVQTVPIDVASEEAVLPGEILHTSPNPRFTNDDDELRSTPDNAMDFTSEESSSSIMDSGSTVPTEVKPTGHPTWRPRRENCTPPAIEQFPRPLMGPYARRHGGLVLHVTVAIFTFFGLAIVCDDYFVSSLDRICEELKLSPDVAGATFMAAGSSAPELATVVIGVFFAKDDIGVSGVIGSAVFNIMFVISVCALCSGTVSHLNWWPLVRDCFFYAISILVMLFTIFDETIAWGEALVMLLMYVVYCIVLHFNSSLERWAHSLKLPIKLPTKEEQSALVTYKNIPEDQLKVANYTSPDIEPIQQPPPLHEQGYNASYTDPNAAWDPNASWDADTGSQAPVYGQPAYNQPSYNQPSYNQPSYNQPSHGWDNPGMQGWNETGDVDNVVPTKTEQTKQNEPKQAVASTTGVQLVGDFYRPARSTELSNPLLKPTEGGILPKISWAVVYPIHYMCRLTMPDCKTEKYKNWYPFTFFMSMIWISFYSYFMVWMITIIGTTLGIPDTVMGLTFVAAGVSVPDALSSIAVIKEGYGDMAVSNAVGSNVFDILICLGLPWFIQTAIIKPGSHVNVISKVLLSALAPDTKNAEAIICSDKCKADKLAGSKKDQPTLPRNINIDEPRYDQSTYRNRAIYFLTVTNPLNIFVSSKELDRAKFIVTKYRNGEELPSCVGVEELWHAKNLYDSAFHPDTGEKMWICGRMSAQVPMNMLITGGMMTFYKSTSSVIFWQWLNQSFNALVNYTNRSGDQAISNTQLGASYVLATSGALATALTLNNAVKRFPPVVGRMVPFAAVAAANCINIPLMRMQELSEGVPVFDQDNLRLGSSKVAAREGIAQVVISRILMASPGMAITPFIMNHLERKGVLRRYPWANAPIQIGLLGVFLTFATPLCCAIFRQKASIRVANLEPELREEIMKKSSNKDIEYVYYNKGL